MLYAQNSYPAASLCMLKQNLYLIVAPPPFSSEKFCLLILQVHQRCPYAGVMVHFLVALTSYSCGQYYHYASVVDYV
jgi:hypothetical protein